MNTYTTNIILILIWGYALLYRNPSQYKKKVFCIIVTVQWILISGLRHLVIGADTIAYMGRFDSTMGRTFLDVWNSFIRTYLYGGGGQDTGYQLFEKLSQLFCRDYRAYLIFIAALFHIPLGVWIDRKSVV